MIFSAFFSIFVFTILSVIPVSLAQQTLCDQLRTLTIPTNALTSEMWYMQLIAFQSQDIPCAKFSFFTGSGDNIISINGSFTQTSNGVEEVIPVNIPVSIANNNGTVVSIQNWPNVKLQFVDYNDGSDFAIPKSIIMLICNAKYDVWALAIATLERNISTEQLLLIEVLADAHNPGLNASLADNLYINQNNCIN